MQNPKTQANNSRKYIKMITNHASKSRKINYAKNNAFCFYKGEDGIKVLIRGLWVNSNNSSNNSNSSSSNTNNSSSNSNSSSNNRNNSSNNSNNRSNNSNNSSNPERASFCCLCF